MNRQDFFEIGSITKSHGIHGEVILEAKSPELIENIKESIIIEIDGLLVPFFIIEIRATSTERCRIKLEWINNEIQAKKILNCQAYIHLNEVEISDHQFEDNYQLLQGFVVTDINVGELGTINYITTDINNPLMSITYKKQEILVPLHSDFIKKLNQQSKSMFIECPEGLIDLFLE